MADPDPLPSLTLAHFAPHIGQSFALTSQQAPASLRLLSAQSSLHRQHAGRRGFSLVFAGQPELTQAVHPLVHPSLGALDIFLVPIGPGEQGQQYEAIFN